MAKTYTIDLPITQTRELRYQRAERYEFEKRFRHFNLPGMKEILFEKVFPIMPDPNDDDKMQPTGGGDLEAQICFLWLGIRHHNPKRITEEQVADWVDLAMEEGRPTVSLVARAINAALASGVLGYIYEAPDPEEEPEGKDDGPSSQSSTAP